MQLSSVSKNGIDQATAAELILDEVKNKCCLFSTVEHVQSLLQVRVQSLREFPCAGTFVEHQIAHVLHSVVGFYVHLGESAFKRESKILVKIIYS